MNATKNVTTEVIGKHGKYTVHLVRLNGNPVGLLEKWKNTRTDTHPWKAFAGVGMGSRFIEAVYGANARQEALDLVIAAAK